jgi:hypothetical protein
MGFMLGTIFGNLLIIGDPDEIHAGNHIDYREP